MRYIKFFVFSWLLTLALAAGFLAWKSRDSAARHAALVQADLPGLIPVRQFFADQSAEWAYRPSADGRYLAWRGTRLAKEVVLIGALSADGSIDEMSKIDKVRHYYWHDLKNRLLILRENRFWEVDPEDPDQDNWIDVTPRGFTNWRIETRLTSDVERQVVTSRDRNPALIDLYTTKSDGSDKQLLLRNEGKTLSWSLRKDQVPLLRFDRGEEGFVILRVNDTPDATEASWRDLMTLSLNETFYVMEVAQDGKTAFATSSLGRDKAAVVKVDLSTGAETVLVSEADEDLFHVLNIDPYDSQIDLAFSKHGESKLYPLSPRGEVFARLVEAQDARIDLDGIHWAGNGRFASVAVSPEAQGYEYYLFDLEEAVSTKLGASMFRKKHLDKLAATEEVSIPARDGLALPALLLKPKGVSGPMPMVLEVHGGPAQHVRWQYNHFRQFLINRGYAVLSVNFRGSNGFGKTFQAAGFAQFGRAMQDDLVDAANWAIAQGIADKGAIAIMGGSYGGYAAAMGMVRDGDVFKAGIAEHAVLDVAYQMRNNPFAWGLTPELMRRYFGDPENNDDYDAMVQNSPQSGIDNLVGPVLLVAGKADRIVGFEQSEAFVRDAEAAGKDIEFLVFEKEGHGLRRWQSNVTHARRVEDFLAQNLGGRSGGWDWIELAVRYFD